MAKAWNDWFDYAIESNGCTSYSVMKMDLVQPLGLGVVPLGPRITQRLAALGTGLLTDGADGCGELTVHNPIISRVSSLEPGND